MTEQVRDGSPHRLLARRLLAAWFVIPLWRRILAALVLGVAAGLAFGEATASLQWIGDVFVRLIRMLVVPLVFVTIASGVASLADPRRLGSIGIRTIAMYVLTTLIAVVVGLSLGTMLAPGDGASLAHVAARAVQAPQDPASLFINIIPQNPFEAMAEGQTLSVIFFALIVGAGVIVAGETAAPLKDLLASSAEVMLRIVGFVMEVAPFGVFALIAVVVGANGPETFVSILKLAMCVAVGSAIQSLIVHGSLIRLLAWLPVIPFFRGIADAIMVGFSTSSSSATLPVAIKVAEANLGIGKPVASTVLPLGATIGMDGAAMYVAMLTMFSAQVFGVELGLASYVTVAITTTLVAMGVAPVPSGSLFVLAAVLATIGITPEQTALIVGFVLPFDRVLDMTRTIPNVTADLAIATVIGRWEKEIDLDVYHSADDV